MINELFVDVKDRMNKAVEHYRHEVSTIRTGRASTNLLDTLKVDFYGTCQEKKITFFITPMNSMTYIHRFPLTKPA